MIQNLSRRERHIAFIALVITLSALVYNFIIEPIFTRWSRLNNEIAAKANALKRDSKLLSSYKTLESDYERLSKYAKSTKREEEEVAKILTEIENTSRINSCFIENIKPQGAKEKIGSYREVLIDVTLEADIKGFSKFLYDIEMSKDMILKVRRFTINSKFGQPNILRCTLLISKILID